jgi:hypothetical protein
LLGWRQGEGGTGFWREFVECEFVGGLELTLPFGSAKDVPTFDGDPEDSGDVWSREDAIDLEQLGVAIGAGDVGDDPSMVVGLLELDHGEHLSADGFVSRPEDQSTELHGFEDVRKGQKVGADAFDVDFSNLSEGTPLLLPGDKPFVCTCLCRVAPSKYMQTRDLRPNMCSQRT